MEERTVVRHKFEAKGDGQPPLEFDLIRETQVESRRSERERFYPKSYGPEDRQLEVIATFTRRGLAALIADGADWLSYVSDE